MFSPSFWARASALLCLSLQAVSAQLPQDPATDPFYVPPPGYENEPLGAILRTRTVVTQIFGLLPNPVESYQLLYRTQSINGSALAGVTTVLKPFGAKTDRFLSYQIAYDSAYSKCEPSYDLQLGAEQNDLISSAEQLLIEALLASGYIVSTPDYEGPEAAWTAGRLSGTGTLDSMRAVNNFGKTLGLSTSSPKIVGMGYSGGAIATGWAASLQPTYAPDLTPQIQGWASGGTPANLTGTAVYIDGTLFSGFLPVAIVGLSKPSAYGAELQPLVNRIITPKGRELLTFASENCGVEAVIRYPFQEIASTEYETEGDRLFYDPILRPILARNTMGVYVNETPTAPVLLYHASQDEIIPYSNASALDQAWCKDGASVDFWTYASGGHGTTLFDAFPDVYKWVVKAFDGGVAKKGCTKETKLDNPLNPEALGVELEPILVGLLNGLAKLGQNDENLKKDLTVLKEPI